MLRSLLALALLLPTAALADSPTELPVQGVLTDDAGLVVQGPVAVHFALYPAVEGSAPVWQEDTTVVADEGHFVAYLGRVAPIDWAIARDNSQLFLGITVEDDSEMGRIPVATTAFAGWADHAGDASTLGGFDIDGILGEVEAGLDDTLHDRYTDTEAVGAMGPQEGSNPLNHARYSDSEAVGAMGAMEFANPLNHERYSDADARGAMGNVIDSNPYAHDRYTHADSVAALGELGDDNPYVHNRYVDAEAVAAMGAIADDNVYAHQRYTDANAISAMGREGNNNPLNHARYTNTEARTTVAEQDRYLVNTGDTMDGNLTVTGAYRDDNSPAAVHFVKMAFWNSSGVINFVRPDGEQIQVTVAGDQAVDTEYIRFRPSGSVHGDGILYFNIEGSPSISCTLLHSEDDHARQGYYYATDGGNNKVGVWGVDGISTFEIARAGVAGNPLVNNSSWAIMCF